MGEPKVMTFRDIGKLRRPNAFIGLNTMDASDPPIEPILLHPGLLSQINKAEPSRAYGDDPVKFAAWRGTEPPVDREFKVTATVRILNKSRCASSVGNMAPKVSTVAEFRAIDYGMEDCQLLLIAPAIISPNSTLHLGPGENWVNIWRLDASFPMDKKTLSWNTRPSRIRQLDKVAMAPGMNYTYQFPCPSDSLHAFEFSAADESTDVVWSQDHSGPNPGEVFNTMRALVWQTTINFSRAGNAAPQ